jgi:O-antigen ligase
LTFRSNSARIDAAALRRALLAVFAVGLGCSITLSQAALAALALLLAWQLRDAEVRGAMSWPLAWPVSIFIGATLLSALSSSEPGTSVLACKGLLLTAALYVVVNSARETDSADRFVSILAIVCGLSAALGLLQVMVCPGPTPTGRSPHWLYHQCHRARGPFSIYMTLAGILNAVLLVSLPRLLPGSRRRWFAPVWFVMLAGLIASYTRGAWLGFAAGVIALLPSNRRGRLLLLGGLCALALTVLGGPAGLRHRLLSMADPDEPTIKERFFMWRSGVAMWSDHRWLGLGPGGVKREFPNYALPAAVKKRTGHVHNTPLQILVERGAVGLAAWLWIWAAFYRGAIRAFRRLPGDATRARALVAGSIAAVTGFLVGGLSEYNFGDSEVVMIAWAVMALPFAVERELCRRSPPPCSGPRTT